MPSLALQSDDTFIEVWTHLNEHVLNKTIHTQSLLHVIVQLYRLGGRGVSWAEELCNAHKHGNQIQTLKNNLHTLNTKAHYSILSTLCHGL